MRIYTSTTLTAPLGSLKRGKERDRIDPLRIFQAHPGGGEEEIFIE